MNYPPTQKTLLERVQNGDEISWDEFYRRYTPIIRAAGKGAGFNDAECCDLVQAVMLKFFSSGATFVYREGKVKFRTWFARIIHSCIVDQVREAQKQKNINAEFPDPPDPFDEIFLEEWRKTALEEAKDELRSRVDEKTWQAFEMYGLQNRDAKQVALILGVTVNQLYVAKNRCTAMLKKIVKHHNEADPEARIEL